MSLIEKGENCLFPANSIVLHLTLLMENLYLLLKKLITIV